MAAYYCYIVECADGTFYTGWTTDPQRRTRQHNLGRGAKYTRQHRPVTLVYVEAQADRVQAQRRELVIKKLNRAQKQKLIQAAPIKAAVNSEENHIQSGHMPDSESL